MKCQKGGQWAGLWSQTNNGSTNNVLAEPEDVFSFAILLERCSRTATLFPSFPLCLLITGSAYIKYKPILRIFAWHMPFPSDSVDGVWPRRICLASHCARHSCRPQDPGRRRWRRYWTKKAHDCQRQRADILSLMTRPPEPCRAAIVAQVERRKKAA